MLGSRSPIYRTDALIVSDSGLFSIAAAAAAADHVAMATCDNKTVENNVNV